MVLVLKKGGEVGVTDRYFRTADGRIEPKRGYKLVMSYIGRVILIPDALVADYTYETVGGETAFRTSLGIFNQRAKKLIGWAQ